MQITKRVTHIGTITGFGRVAGSYILDHSNLEQDEPQAARIKCSHGAPPKTLSGEQSRNFSFHLAFNPEKAEARRWPNHRMTEQRIRAAEFQSQIQWVLHGKEDSLR